MVQKPQTPCRLLTSSAESYRSFVDRRAGKCANGVETQRRHLAVAGCDIQAADLKGLLSGALELPTTCEVSRKSTTAHFIAKVARSEDMAQKLKFLPPKHEDLNSDRQNM